MLAGFIRRSLQRSTNVPDPDRVVSIFCARRHGRPCAAVAREFARLCEIASTFATLGALQETRSEVRFEGRSLLASVAVVTPDLLAVLKLSPAKGAIVNERLWRAEFSAPAAFVGCTLTIGGTRQRIGGFMAETFDGLYIGSAIDIWAQRDEQALTERDRQTHNYWTIGRLRDDVSLPQAQMNVVAAFAANGEHRETTRIVVMAQRARQLLADAAIVAIVGAVGVLCAAWASRIISALLFDQDATALSFSPDITTLFIVCAASLSITIARGLAPLWDVRDDDQAAVRRRESGGLSIAARRVRASLVAGQMAVSCLLLITTGLLLVGFRAAMRTTLGGQLGEPVVAQFSQ